MLDPRNKRITVAGLGRFGGQIAAARWLVEQGATVVVTDLAPAEKLSDSLKQLDDLPIEYHLGGHREEDFTNVDAVVASPAIAPHSPYLRAAANANVPITTEIRLFLERCNATVIGVTGTKGKSTTTAMLGEMLNPRFKTWVGGNIGRPLLLQIPNIARDDLVVLELSSFMLHHLREMRWSPHVALITMISADHLDWHGSVEEYVEAKGTILRFQGEKDYAVLNETDAISRELARRAAAQVRWYGAGDWFELRVPGEHNQLNAQAAFAAAQIFGITRQQAQAALHEFRGLPHRLELVHESNGVRYFNDSIATIPDAAVAALNSFPPKSVIQIVGGRDKGLAITALCNALVERAKAVLCIGETGAAIAAQLAESSYQGESAVYSCGDLPTAMQMARRIAAAGDVVLLSPGFASYDQFTHFEQRGLAFAALARGD